MKSIRSERICPSGHRYFKSSDCLTCPICEKEQVPDTAFLSSIAAPARRALQGAGINSLQQLSHYSKEELLKLHGFGPASLPILEKLLAESGLAFQLN